jgi:hypothetical protein
MERKQYLVIDADSESDILKNGIHRISQSIILEDGNEQLNKDHVPLMNHLSKSSADNLHGYLMVQIIRPISKVDAIPEEIGNYFLSYRVKNIRLKPDEFKIIGKFRSTYEPPNGADDINGFF